MVLAHRKAHRLAGSFGQRFSNSRKKATGQHAIVQHAVGAIGRASVVALLPQCVQYLRRSQRFQLGFRTGFHQFPLQGGSLGSIAPVREIRSTFANR